MLSTMFTIFLFIASNLSNQVSEGLFSHGLTTTNNTSLDGFIGLSMPTIEIKKSRRENIDGAAEDDLELERARTAVGTQNPHITFSSAKDQTSKLNRTLNNAIGSESSRRTLGGSVVKFEKRVQLPIPRSNPRKNISNQSNMPDFHAVNASEKLRRRKPFKSLIHQSTNTTNKQTEIEIVLRLCAFSPYSDPAICRSQSYFEDPLSHCERTWALVLLVSVATMIGVAIVTINALIPLVVLSDRKMRTQYYVIKASLALADMIVGILLLGALIPNIFHIRNLTEEKATEFIIEHTNSPDAIIAGSLLTVSKQASLLHLMFLSVQRFGAIKWSLWHVGRTTASAAAILIGIWVVSIISAFIPAAFPTYFAYQFQPAILLHMLTLQPQPDADELDWRGPLYASLTFFLPYAITVIFSILTGIVSYRKLKSTAKYFGQNHITLQGCHGQSKHSSATNIPSNSFSGNGDRSKCLQPEITVFLTLLFMIAAFTITLLPYTIVAILLVTETLDCGNYIIPYTTSFFIALLNSLANGLIYSVRDKEFRSSVGHLPSLLRSLLQGKKVYSPQR